jgi:bifunctional UDP-N-acetylglucosamine pyrophosphorylase/glucosamine-1-phosphate N-acetyltransferase
MEKTQTPVKRNITAILLAAGKGTRMKSALPKVLHPVAGRPMISRIIQSCRNAEIKDIRIVIGHGSGLVKTVLENESVFFYEQKEQLGTADAVKSAQIDNLEDDVLILNGDHPLIESEDLTNFIKEFREQKLDIGLVTTKLKNPGEFGRIVRSGGELYSIVEAKDASAETLKINEVNTGIYILKASILREFLPEIKNNNLKKEFYFTDIISLAIEERKKVKTISGNARVAAGVNSQVELAKATRYIFKAHVQKLMENGVLVIDPKATYIEESVKIGSGSVIYPGVYLKGKTQIGSFCLVEPHCFIHDCQIADSVQIKAGSYLESSIVHSKCSIGPYARLRPESELLEEVHIGNFVEIKKSKLGKKTKAAHLAYVGDAEVGEECNIGCGTIFVNYLPNKSKHKTKIGNNTFIGSDVQLIAPLEVGSNATIGAGSVITKNVPDGALAVTRASQMIKENYQPKK